MSNAGIATNAAGTKGQLTFGGSPVIDWDGAGNVNGIASINGGGIPFRNKIRNGACRIQQRANGTLASTAQYVVDGFQTVCAGGAGVSGTIRASSAIASASHFGIDIFGASWSNGNLLNNCFVESADSAELSGKTVTVSYIVSHNFGVPTNFGIAIYKANAVDNFSAVTKIVQSPNVSCASLAYTQVSFTVTLGATDADNGLMIQLVQVDTNTVSNKEVVFGDIQLVAGSVVPKFEVIPYALDFAWCQRFYEVGSNVALFSGNVTSGAAYYKTVRFQVKKRATPTVTPIDVANLSFPAGAPSAANVSADSFYTSKTANLTGAGYYQFGWTATAEL